MKISATDIAVSASASAIVFEALRKAIIDGDLKEGEPLRQDEIAKLFNISRIPVREAISRLEEQGLVKTQRYKGAVVAGVSADEAREIQNLRILVEPEILRQAVPRMSEADLDHARACCAAFAGCDDPRRWSDLNRAFHAALYAPSGLSYFIEVAGDAMDRVDRYLRLQLLLSDGMPQADAEHREILAACEARDAEGAAERMRAHLTGVRDSLMSHIDRR